MPELPEVETALRGVSPYLKGFTIEKIVVRQPQLRWVVSPELTTLKNVKILDTSRRAKYLIIHTEKGYIIGHLGMSGSVRIVPHDSPIDKHDHLDILMNNGKLLRYNDPRRFGAWLWTESLGDFHLFLKLGPEPLSDEFNAEYLFKKSRKKSTALKTFLMDNAVVVGVGTEEIIVMFDDNKISVTAECIAGVNDTATCRSVNRLTTRTTNINPFIATIGAGEALNDITTCWPAPSNGGGDRCIVLWDWLAYHRLVLNLYWLIYRCAIHRR